MCKSMTSVECVVPTRGRFSFAVLNLHNCMLISSSVPRCCASRSRQWHPTPALLPGKSHGRRSLVGCRLRGCTELDTTEVIQQQQPCIRMKTQLPPEACSCLQGKHVLHLNYSPLHSLKFQRFSSNASGQEAQHSPLRSSFYFLSPPPYGPLGSGGQAFPLSCVTGTFFYIKTASSLPLA